MHVKCQGLSQKGGRQAEQDRGFALVKSIYCTLCIQLWPEIPVISQWNNPIYGIVTTIIAIYNQLSW